MECTKQHQKKEKPQIIKEERKKDNNLKLLFMQKMNLPWVESPFFEQILAEKPGTPEQKAQARFFHENGYLILKNIIPTELIDATIEDISNLYPNKVGEEPLRHQDLWKKHENVKQIATYPQIIELLEYLYGREVIPFQTLNFKYGTQQRAHSDSIHFSCMPARYMCGVWLAMEPTNDQNGALFYYPKSHRLPEYNYYDIGIKAHDDTNHYGEYETFMENLMGNHQIERQELYIEKGDALVWSSNIIHGGTPIRTDGLTRWSQVTHYYFDNCVYYTPMHSDMLSHDLFIRNITNIRTGKIVANKSDGSAIDTIKTNERNAIISNSVPTSKLILGTIKRLIKPLIGKK